jgi:hypothetical protein
LSLELQQRAALGLAAAAVHDPEDRWGTSCCSCRLGGDLLCCEGPGCTVAMHATCAGLPEVPEGDWLCSSCSSVAPAAGMGRGRIRGRGGADSSEEPGSQLAGKRRKGSSGSAPAAPAVFDAAT